MRIVTNAAEFVNARESAFLKWEAQELLVHVREFHAETSEHEIPKFWNEYYADEACRRVPGYLGVCAQEKTEGDTFRYGIGCLAKDAEGTPEGFEILRLPEHTWAVFTCVGPVPVAIMIIGWRNQSRIRLISLPNDKFGSE